MAFPSPLPRLKPNPLGVKGWALGGRWGVERYAYTLHRITGLGILSYFLMHIFVTSARLFGKGYWDAFLSIVDHPAWKYFFKTGELLVFIAFCLHGLNGIRLIMVELGVAVGRPDEPVYPYRSSLHKQRPLLIICMAAASLLIILGGWNFFLALGHQDCP